MSKPQQISAKDQLEKLRAGQDQILEIKYGELVIPLKLLSAHELATAAENGRNKLKKIVLPSASETNKTQMESIAVMKEILRTACTPHLNDEFLGLITSVELEILYDQFLLINNKVNPQYDKLDDEEILALIAEIKKKTTPIGGLSSYQLGEIGRYFLAQVLPLMVKGAGTN